ncbi:hypothetical protein GCM10023194_31400 [Planotetraspora phitsanulokensis]|uniref:Uncharacterized protein n=1 Tax=Planotetraspora phitsanulokensis TaxID=575192 RepID=A0A8J3XC40_9ACTN|nr:hypothetical protein Pph01_07250 [Planotetraspora phitsanulokensis]
MLSRLAIRGPVTACFQTPVCTVLPCQDTSFGIPTFTDNSFAIMILAIGAPSERTAGHGNGCGLPPSPDFDTSRWPFDLASVGL